MQDFIKAYMENPVFTDQCFGYKKLREEVIERDYEGKTGDQDVRTGAILQENGDFLFKIFAPDANTVKIEVTIDPETPDLILEKQADGFFTGVLPYSIRLAGPKTVNVYIDGALVLYPHLPIFYWYHRPANYVEIPDENQMFLLERNIPRGSIVRDYYYSETMGEWESCMVYLPPSYNVKEQFPVLYLQHGHTENEITWVNNGKIPYILDNMIDNKEAVPMVVVMNNGMVRKQGEPDFCYDSFEQMILNDCIPFIEKKYSVYTDKWNRAMAGLSMGSAQTSFIAIKHPELFSNIGLFSGFLSLSHDNIRVEDCEHLLPMKNKEKFESDVKVFYRSIGALDSLKPRFDEDQIFIEENGIDKLSNYHEEILPDHFHDWGTWRIAVRHFLQLIFK